MTGRMCGKGRATCFFVVCITDNVSFFLAGVGDMFGVEDILSNGGAWERFWGLFLFLFLGDILNTKDVSTMGRSLAKPSYMSYTNRPEFMRMRRSCTTAFMRGQGRFRGSYTP